MRKDDYEKSRQLIAAAKAYTVHNPSQEAVNRWVKLTKTIPAYVRLALIEMA